MRCGWGRCSVVRAALHGSIASPRSISSSSSSSSDRRLRFFFDAENEVPIFYANRIGSFWFEQDFHALFRRAYRGTSGDGAMDYAKLDPAACIAAMETIGHTPANREIGVCTIPKLFHEKGCYRIRQWTGELMGREFFYHDVLLRPLELQRLLLEEELAKNGVVRRARFAKTKAWIESAAVKHGVEVELMKQQGSNPVIFLSRQGLERRSAIVKELEKAGVCVEDGIKLQLWRPEEDALYADTPLPSEKMAAEKMRRMNERLAMTHCQLCPRTEGEPVEWYEESPSRPLYGRDYGFTTDKLVIDIDTNRWRRNENAIPWEERLLATPGGKFREVLTIVDIDGTPADLMLPKKRVRGWGAAKFDSGSARRKSPSRKIKFFTDFLKKIYLRSKLFVATSSCSFLSMTIYCKLLVATSSC
ncbi:uncharacterized protein LOC112349185 [Selaginella moellendorffii]|uniref:uncharacterized protein LOC112349185 n=1 Tax=Selaginella moellendorffii TaxID=88036 RepID=UPI000D1D10A8|nr:uncharacterized protein LOC112349185 [Selaginella moellendorffii]|eukprot:XP_024538883.1 uncharacterized protein LOC112349185 [Selaginella moellendorffii]